MLKLKSVYLAIAVFLGVAGATLPALAQQTNPVNSIVEKWLGSGHGDASSLSFSYWNEAGEIPPACAKCHSGAGFSAFHGFDGSEPGVIAQPIPTGDTVECVTCHREGIDEIDSIVFPSGLVVSDAGPHATCLTCHQGRQSSIGVQRAVGDTGEDEINPELTFLNPHYAAAAATLYGTEVKGAYEYPGKSYVGRFAHVPTFAQCSDCHDPHSLEIKISECVACHQTEDPKAMRISPADFDGDGDVKEGIYHEIASLNATLKSMVIEYASKVTKKPVLYADAYPYFFNDTNENGVVDEGEATRSNSYVSWTPRMLKAAYNYQYVAKDKGAYAHNPHYALQVLHDSIESLSEPLGATSEGLVRP
ncbi:hypothetical protein [Maritalea porphyrae]|uniref:hypothetical protein n=1 Tax=Maritalea porphyrae TaxID=880732 RepID=UPI0022B0796C|nr:hypothetical protein [Maritalea porphyrae]MCZ4273438.1 hypothetical protein [Maritalea porphyrae]